MTTELTSEVLARAERPRSWGEIAASFANQLATPEFPRGDLAALRRMDPDAPNAAAFWRLMATQELLGSPSVESKWALVLHGIALMTRSAGDDAKSRSAHDKNTPVGKALFYGNDPSRSAGFYSESRLNRLLTARGPMLRTLLARLFRMLASAGQPFNWYQMTQLILNDDFDEDRADAARRNIARDYYWAENRANRQRD